MALLRTKALATTAEVKREIGRLVERQKAATAADLALRREEIDALLGSFSEFLPEWRRSPSVFRVARLEAGKSLFPGTPWHHRAGVVPVLDNVVLPELKHELPMVIEMLNFIRGQKGLDAIRMPLFLQPDEIMEAIRSRDDRDHEDDAADPRRDERGEAARGGRRRQSMSPEQLRRAVHDRHGWRCRDCGETLDLHLHRLEVEYAEDDPEGYATLCRRCLRKAEGAGLTVGPSVTARGYELEDQRFLDDLAIRSQLAVVFQKGAIDWVGFVFGKRYLLLKN